MRLIDADELKKCVLKWLQQDPCGREEKEFPFETDICVSMLMEIDEQPTITPEPHWIWIGTKRFGTTISDEVYVTFENPKGERFCKHLSFQNGKLSAFDKSTIDAFYKGSKPIAWMPLPEHYKEVTE